MALSDEEYAKVEAYLNERIRQIKAEKPLDYPEEVFDKVRAERKVAMAARYA